MPRYVIWRDGKIVGFERRAWMLALYVAAGFDFTIAG